MTEKRDNGRHEQADHVFEAQAFVLRDTCGNLKAALGLDDHGQPKLSFFDPDGGPRLTVGLDGQTGAPGTVLYDSCGNQRLLVRMADENGDSPLIAMLDADGTVLADLSLSEDGDPTLALRDPAGWARCLLGLGEDGQPVLELRDQDGVLRAALQLEADGEPQLGLADEGGQLRIVVTLPTPGNGVPSLFVYDDAGTMRTAVGSGAIGLFDQNERATWCAPLPNAGDGGPVQKRDP